MKGEVSKGDLMQREICPRNKRLIIINRVLIVINIREEAVGIKIDRIIFIEKIIDGEVVIEVKEEEVLEIIEKEVVVVFIVIIMVKKGVGMVGEGVADPLSPPAPLEHTASFININKKNNFNSFHVKKSCIQLGAGGSSRYKPPSGLNNSFVSGLSNSCLSQSQSDILPRKRCTEPSLHQLSFQKRKFILSKSKFCSPTNELAFLDCVKDFQPTNEVVSSKRLKFFVDSNVDDLFFFREKTKKDEDSLVGDENSVKDGLEVSEGSGEDEKEDIVDEEEQKLKEQTVDKVDEVSFLSDFNTKLGVFTNIWCSPDQLIFCVLLALKHIPYVSNGFHLWPADFSVKDLGTTRDWMEGCFDMSLIYLQNMPYDIIPLVLETQAKRYKDLNNRAIFI